MFGGRAGSEFGSFFETHALVAEIGEQAVAALGRAFHRFAMRMEPIPPFLGF